MPATGYSTWTVVAGEQPTASKWNILGSNDAAFNSGAGLNDGAIVSRHLGTDSSYAWASWVPTFTNITVNNGTLVARFKQIGKTVYFYMSLTWGSTTSASGVTQFTFPVAASSNYVTTTYFPVGIASYLRQGVAFYQGWVVLQDSTHAHFVNSSSSTPNIFADTNGTTPNTFAATDIWACSGSYEAA